MTTSASSLIMPTSGPEEHRPVYPFMPGASAAAAPRAIAASPRLGPLKVLPPYCRHSGERVHASTSESRGRTTSRSAPVADRRRGDPAGGDRLIRDGATRGGSLPVGDDQPRRG